MTRSATRRPLLPALLAAVLVSAAGLWAGGCDFTRVDEGADVPLQQHLDALATASTPDAAERAIRGVLNKVGVRTEWQADLPDDALAFGSYFASEAEIRTLAEAQARFVSGQEAPLETIAGVHKAVVEADDEARAFVRELSNEVGVTPQTRGPIVVNAAEATGVLQSEVVAALGDPEAPTHAMVLAIAADGRALPSSTPTFDASRSLSPAQRFLFSVWLHHNGPFLFPYLTRDIDRLPVEDTSDAARVASSPKTWPCEACCGDDSKLLSMTLLWIGPESQVEATISNPTNGLGTFKPYPATTLQPLRLFTVDGAGRPSTGTGLTGTLGNNVIIRAGSTLSTTVASIHTSCSTPLYPGMVFGVERDGVWYKVLIVSLRTRENGLCSTLEFCVGACKAQLVGCKLRAGEDSEARAACFEEYRACDLNCHDQGGID